MENLQKENVVLWEQYQKLPQDNNMHLISAAGTHQTHMPEIDEADKT